MDDYIKTLKQLGAMAQGYPKDSEEYRALEQATIAYIFVQDEKFKDRFKKFLLEFHDELTPEQRKHLEELGVDIDT